MHNGLKWLLLALLLILPACGPKVVTPGETRTQSETVELGAAEQVEVQVQQGISNLTLQGGASELLEAEFQYNLDELEPTVSYNVDGSKGTLLVTANREEPTSILPTGEIVSEWSLRLKEGVPLDVKATLGAGTATLDFSQLLLSDLTLTAGGGQVDIRLGEQALEDILLTAGVGTFDLQANGAIRNFRLIGGAGTADLDLSGAWTEDMEGQIDMGLGTISLTLPKDVGIRVAVSAGPTIVEAEGFEKDGDAYVNELYGEGDVSFDIKVNSGVGKLTLKMSE